MGTACRSMETEAKSLVNKRTLAARMRGALTQGYAAARQRPGLLFTSALLISAVAVVQPEAMFRAPLFRLGSAPPARALPAPWSSHIRTQPDFVCLLIIGGLRADRAGFELEPTGELPRLERFAAQATRFESTSAQASSSLVSLKSMLSGRYPANLILHGTGADQRSLIGIENPRSFMLQTFAEVQTGLGTWLRQSGYQTSAFSDAPWAREDPGFGENFQADEQSTDSSILQAARWIWDQGPDYGAQRRAVIVHVEELSLPQTPARNAELAYRSALQTLDAQVGELMLSIHGRKLWQEGLVIITSDHGTSLGERGIQGHGGLYHEQLMVPLGIKFPASWKVPPGVMPGGVELVDLLPTIQEICGGDQEQLDGRSALPVALRGKPGRKWLVAQTSLSGIQANPTTRCVIAPKRWQLIQDARADGLLFYALESDPLAIQPVQPGGLEVPSFVTKLFTSRLPD